MARAATTKGDLSRARRPDDRGHVHDLWPLRQEELASLLALRPDLADPVPTSMDEIEGRALSSRSVLLALLGADTAIVQAVQVLALLGGPHVAIVDLRRMLGDVPEAEVHRQLAWLTARRLVAPVSSAELCVHPVLVSALVGAGALGPPAASVTERLTVDDMRSILRAVGRKPRDTRRAAVLADLEAFLADGDAVRALVASAPEGVQKLALGIAAGSVPCPATSPYGYGPRQAAADPCRWLIDHGLVYRRGWTETVMPREVGLALRGGHPFPPSSYLRPTLDLAPPAPAGAGVAARACATAADAVRAIERLVECWGSRPGATLKTGGVGVREIRRLAGDIEVGERDAFRLVEIAAHAGLVAVDRHSGLAMPTQAADDWLDLGTPERWWAIASGWWSADGYPGLAGAQDIRGKALPALLHSHIVGLSAPVQRRSFVEVVLEAGGAGPHSGPDLARLASWDAPLAWMEGLVSPALAGEWLLAEMALLGLLVDGVPSPLARALSSGDAAAAHAEMGGPDADTWQLVLQADLSALATGPLPPRIRAELERMADVEGRGQATVYRFSEGSLRRAFDAGRSGDEVLGFLAEHAAKGLPQALEYLVGDIERRHGHIRVGRAACFMRFDDPALAAAAVRTKRGVKLGLRQIAPTVLICDRPVEVALEALRADGFLPVAETADGAVVHESTDPQRAEPVRPPGGPPAPARATSPGRVDVDAIAAALTGQGPTTRARGGDHHLPVGAARGGQLLHLPTLLRRAEGPVPGGHLDESFDDELFDGSFDDAWEDDLIASGPGSQHGATPLHLVGSDGDERPTRIVHDPAGVAQMLSLASSEGWLVRISYTTGAGRTQEVTMDVLDVGGTAVLGRVPPRWVEQRYVLTRIAWARVLTEEEEEIA